ncbi:MAG: hypothetical protein BWY75_02164 [bacterium ADurb.Bin425]|nr:MAG: hypothetical protein BWY75_02164 [bacterium ADurb.Bin425]
MVRGSSSGSVVVAHPHGCVSVGAMRVGARVGIVHGVDAVHDVGISAYPIKFSLGGEMILGRCRPKVISCRVVVGIFSQTGPQCRIAAADVADHGVKREVAAGGIVGADGLHGCWSTWAMREDVGVLIHVDTGGMEQLVVEDIVGAVIDHGG